MTSTDLVQKEIDRFIRSPDPEVLCITGAWGVGKTFTWHQLLDAARKAKAVALTRYSYASLFGINSLEDLRLALFQNLEFLDAPAQTKIELAVHGSKAFVAYLKQYTSLTSAIPYVGTGLSKSPLFFSAIRGQIVCIDDLERRGDGLSIKDVLGIISFLREQRACKVVLLLNEDALDEHKKEFDDYFEKTIDTRLVFAPTASEAAGIALPQNNNLSNLLRTNCIVLGISNIRVIKKIERLTAQVEPLVKGFLSEVLLSAIRSMALFGWSKFQPGLAPPIEFIRVGTIERYLDEKHGKAQSSEKDKQWDALLTRFNFTHMDNFDEELWKFVDTGILDPEAVIASAKTLNEQLLLQKKTGSYEQAWRPLHDSFDDDLEVVIRSIIEGLNKNVDVVSLLNLDLSVKILKDLGEATEAKSVIEFYVRHKGGDQAFWDTSSNFFQPGPFDPDVEDAISAQKAKMTTAEVFEPSVELIKAAKSFDADTIKKLAKVPVDEYYNMVKSRKGAEMREVVLSALEFRRIGNASDDMREVVRRMEEALRRIGSESELNALRVRKFGV